MNSSTNPTFLFLQTTIVYYLFQKKKKKKKLMSLVSLESRKAKIYLGKMVRKVKKSDRISQVRELTFFLLEMLEDISNQLHSLMSWPG